VLLVFCTFRVEVSSLRGRSWYFFFFIFRCFFLFLCVVLTAVSLSVVVYFLAMLGEFRGLKPSYFCLFFSRTRGFCLVHMDTAILV